MKRALAVVLAAAIVLVAPAPAFAADSSYRTLASADNPDWMRSQPDGKSLAALSIPGTHQSLSITGGSLTQTQENYGNSANTLTAQLRAGIRMIDVRARVNTGNTFTIHHGATYQNANFDDVLARLAEFLGAHPGETVVLRLKQECHGGLGSCTDVSGQRPFTDIFDSYVAKRPGLFWTPSVTRSAAAPTPTLGQIRGKVVLAVLNGPRGGVVDRYGLAQFSGWQDGSSEWVQDNYNVPNVGAIATKRDQVRRFLDATSAGDPGKMYVNFGSGSSVFAQPYQVAGGALGVQGVNPFLLTYLNEGPEVHTPVSRTGMLLLDFPGGGLIDKVIGYN
ncbi:phosphatidylinositol-specific phospholipase C [Paractinoplanes lichenicola]|uniref:1-phosphatidylinositol phosphodiesterase n=1 Tax=Paractinoplanes lichenicola TaxID=2802976 RepID=A0ABS1VZ64_9ACTN|nr:phosphatidylinositol-specific phospholipase C [Actinoplanes lichenicola]MBL7259778.1 phosphatidylinositol-specific phospholipase C [Actinoplanes lichenicola]